MKKQTDPRHLARKIALQRLFEHFFAETTKTKETAPKQAKTKPAKSQVAFKPEELSKIDDITFYDEELTQRLYRGVIEELPEIDSIITKYAPEWPISQIAKTDLQILRIAIYEGFITESVPVKVATDEAIELAKEFGGSASSKFVNGVLGSLIREKEQGDKPQPKAVDDKD